MLNETPFGAVFPASGYKPPFCNGQGTGHCTDACELSDCRPLREELYRAFITRASSGETDNTPLIEKTLVLRQEQAELLGYPNYAEVSLASKVCL